MNIIKNIILWTKYGYKYSSESYYNYLKKCGIKLGNNVKFYSPWTIQIDIQRPWMIEIGNDVHITSGVRILQHGYDWCVIQKKYGEVLGSSGKVKIGNNVFIGVNSSILKGVTIGDNVIIGANSLVNKDCIKEGVYAGNPIKYIMSLDEYYEKRKSKQLEEAIEIAKEYYKTYNKYPEKEIFREYFWLFENNENKLCKTFDNVMKLENNEEKSYKTFKETKKQFSNYEEFLERVRNEK